MWNWRISAASAISTPRTSLWHGPRMREVYGQSAVTQLLIGLLAMIPDGDLDAAPHLHRRERE